MTHEIPDLCELRRDYGLASLEDQALCDSPIDQFDLWLHDLFENASLNELSMVLSTVDSLGHPDARVVLLKGVESGKFVFYTHYNSKKAQQIASHPYVSLTLYWPSLARQVRIRGSIIKTSSENSDSYFASRPFLSQISAVISPQSQEIQDPGKLLQQRDALALQYPEQHIPRPADWGGFAVTPNEIEFWQGRTHRLHDRVLYQYTDNQWSHKWLAP